MFSIKSSVWEIRAAERTSERLGHSIWSRTDDFACSRSEVLDALNPKAGGSEWAISVPWALKANKAASKVGVQ